MHLGFVTAILPELSLEEIIDFAAEENFSALEVMCWPKGKAERRYAGVTHIDLAELPGSRISEINAKLTAANISISSLGYYPNPLCADHGEAQVYIDHLHNLIATAPKLGVHTVTSFIGRDPAKSIDGNWPRFKQVWEPLVKHAGDHGVKIGIENCPMFFTGDEWPGGKNLAYSPDIWRRMFDTLPSDHLGLNYDPSHFAWLGLDVPRALREFKDKLFHVHAKDARVDRDRLADVSILADPLQFHSPKLPGLGDVDWPEFFSTLGEVNYTGPVCIEVEDKAYEHSLEARKGALRQSARFLNQFITPENSSPQ
ncbi:MAG: sugar phosphate isomerase/epimerase [Verrucomicrobiales bacterium]|nr:sugar phosphate isomerase/epimerase [Verrucomicrobiales bacterium]